MHLSGFTPALQAFFMMCGEMVKWKCWKVKGQRLNLFSHGTFTATSSMKSVTLRANDWRGSNAKCVRNIFPRFASIQTVGASVGSHCNPGVTYIHKSNVTRHVKSGSLHNWAKQKFSRATRNNNNNNKTTSTVGSSDASESRPSGNSTSQLESAKLFLKDVREQRSNHFATELMVVAKERPFSDLWDLIELQTKNGVKYVSGKNNSEAGRGMIAHLLGAVHQGVEAVLKNCSFLACEQDGWKARKTTEEKEWILYMVAMDQSFSFCFECTGCVICVQWR